MACAVFGTPAMAEGGQLVCVLAGPKEDVEEVVPYCKGMMGRANIDFGGQPPEKATLLKVIGNTFILSMVETISEGQVVAEKTRCAHEERGDGERIPEGCQGAHRCARRYRRNLRCEKS